MNVYNPPSKARSAPTKRRISARVRKAIKLRVEKGFPWDVCAERAGLACSSIYKAKQQPHVIKYLEEQKALYCKDIEALEDAHKARALEVARELLDDEENKAVRARMVEFLRGGKGQNAVNVQINNNIGQPQGYEFVPPNAQVIDITPADQTQDVVSKPSNERGD